MQICISMCIMQPFYSSILTISKQNLITIGVMRTEFELMQI